ncbi:DUF4283 domain-containing protein, partial [Cephalotus follicularis]
LLPPPRLSLLARPKQPLFWALFWGLAPHLLFLGCFLWAKSVLTLLLQTL